MKTHLLIPDLQIRPNVPLQHLTWIGKYIVDTKPDVVVQIGDFADMHSLSSYDMGRKSGEGARYKEDIEVANKAMDMLMAPVHKYNKKQRKNKKARYQPQLELTLGNHENRINKHVNSYPILEDHLSSNDFNFIKHGWNVHEFLEVVEIDGILYSHYFPRNATGKIVQSYRGAPNARSQVIREMQSCTSGHMQGLDFHVQQTGTRRNYGLMAGSCYLHDEDYLTPQGTAYWRGIVVKHQVKDGSYDPMMVSLGYLARRYGTAEDIKNYGHL